MRLVGLALLVMLVAGCASDPDAGDGDYSADDYSSDELTDDPIEQMSIAFQGSPDRDEIRDAMDNALNATNTPITDENYSRAASVLITFRQKHGFSEMKQLECIPTRTTDTRLPALKFQYVAAVCITDLVEGRYP